MFRNYSKYISLFITDFRMPVLFHLQTWISSKILLSFKSVYYLALFHHLVERIDSKFKPNLEYAYLILLLVPSSSCFKLENGFIFSIFCSFRHVCETKWKIRMWNIINEYFEIIIQMFQIIVLCATILFTTISITTEIHLWI